MSTVNGPTKQGTAGSRLAQIPAYAKMLFLKDTYVNGFKNCTLTAVSVLSIIALYWVIAAVWVRNAIRSLRGRRATNVVVTRKTPPGDSEPIIKPVEDIGLNMDDVQEIPGEGEMAAKEAMPSRDQIPEIDDEPVENTEERHIMSDDDTTVVGQDELVSVKGSPVVVPVIKHDFERPISPPATPPIEASDSKAPAVDVVEALQANSSPDAPAVVNVIPDDSFVLRETPARNSTIEEATKAVEEHARFLEDATSPTESMTESTKLENDSPVSEFVVVSDVEEKPIKDVLPPIEISNRAIEEADSKPSVAAGPEIPALEAAAPTEPATEPEQIPTIVVEESKADTVAPIIEEPKPIEQVEEPKAEPQAVEEPKAVEGHREAEPLKVVEKPEVVEAPKVTEEPKAVEKPAVEEPKVAEEPKVVEEPESVEEPKLDDSPKSFPSVAKPGREDSVSSSPPKSLARPRVVRRATGSTSAIAGITTSPAPATVAVAPAVDDRASARAQTVRRADDALNRLAGSILRSNTSDRLPGRPTSPVRSAIPRPSSPPPRSSSPFVRSESPSSDAGAGSRPASRRGSVTAPRPPSRQSTLANVTNAPERSTPPARRATFANPPRGGSVSPPPMPLPPQRRGSQGTVSPQGQGSVRGSLNPQVPQAAVTSSSILSRNATIDSNSNGSPGSPPNGRRAASPSPRSPAEGYTSDQGARRNVPFPSPVEGQPTGAAAMKQRPRPRTSTSGSATAPTAPNTLLATLTSRVPFTGGSNSSSNSASSPVSPSPASPNRSDSFASAVSNRSSIYSFSDMSDMDMPTSDLDFAGRESHRMVLNGARFDSMSSIASSDGDMSGNDEEKQKKRAKRRAKARAQALKKQKRSKRN